MSNNPLSLFFSRLFLEREGVQKEFHIESSRPLRKNYIIKLGGIDTLPQAQELIGEELLLPEEDLQILEEGNYYFFQIIGCSVFTKSREKVGKVKSLLCIKNNDLLIVEREEKEIFVPFSKSICLEVNLEQKEIVIDPPRGLLELNEI